MKKINKGFTLTEMLGVLTLLGIIAVITVPAVKDMLDDSKQKLYDEQIKQIELGLKNWANANIFLLPESEDTITLSLGQLKQMGYAEVKITNPKNNKCFSNESLLTIKKYNNSYIYNADNMIDVNCNLTEDTPVIKLNGSLVKYLNIGDTYIEEGASAKNNSGTDISSNIVTTITGTNTTINTSVTGNYIITYSITDNNKTVTAIRNVFVK